MPHRQGHHWSMPSLKVCLVLIAIPLLALPVVVLTNLRRGLTHLLWQRDFLLPGLVINFIKILVFSLQILVGSWLLINLLRKRR